MAKKVVKRASKKVEVPESDLVTLLYLWNEELLLERLEFELNSRKVVSVDDALSLMERFPLRFEVVEGKLPKVDKKEDK